MTELIGVPTSLSVRVSRRLTDGTYGSFEVSAELGVELPADVDLTQAFDAADAWLTASVAKSVSEKQVDIGVAQHAQQAPPVQQEIERVPVVGDSETEVVEITGYVIEYAPSGQKTLKVKGGKYPKHGVKVWPEMAEKNAQLSDWESKDPGEYTIVGKLTAVVLLDGGKAKKVIGWK
jgi:hypothetical protein